MDGHARKWKPGDMAKLVGRPELGMVVLVRVKRTYCTVMGLDGRPFEAMICALLSV